jgi:hypothetical protein
VAPISARLRLRLLAEVGNPAEEVLARIILKYRLVNGKRQLAVALRILPGGR